jgi:hypothetical protein
MRFRNPMYNGLGMVRKRPGASLRSPLNVGFGSRRPFYPGIVDCPEAGAAISFESCLRCPRFRVWSAQDDGFRRCWHEYKALEERGYYDGTWDDHPENFDPETFERIQETKRLDEEFASDFEREKLEMAHQAEALARNSKDSRWDEFPWLDDDCEDDEEGETERAQDDEDEDEY